MRRMDKKKETTEGQKVDDDGKWEHRGYRGVEEGWTVEGMTVKSNETEGKESLEHDTGQSIIWMRHFLFYMSEISPSRISAIFFFLIVAVKSNHL